MNTDNLEHQFTEELKDKMLRAKRACRYNPTRFNQMIARHGGVETAKQLISSGLRTGHPSDGYTTLRMICQNLHRNKQRKAFPKCQNRQFSLRKLAVLEKVGIMDTICSGGQVAVTEL